MNDAQCRRCGECCRKGGPALHRQDLGLFSGEKALDLCDVVTLRAGERVYDQVLDRVLPLEAEMLKFKGADGTWACVFLDAEAGDCTLYARRPAECRALFCADTAPLAAMYDKDRLTRRDLLPEGHPVLAVLAEHEALVPPRRMAELADILRTAGPNALGGAEGAEAAAELARMALADRAFRENLATRAHIGQEYHDFFFGRDARALFAAVGLTLREDARTGLRAQLDPLWRG
ncbi:MAG: hypothetical protein AUJ49_05535 [Desulfovibrionaceae bacterium CG1_02_65_16]|nr:MAG: hypothetical protein AUJ49_05535 [Desulfovibrionaceae bacterium CG1_02_65_16]